MESKKPKLTSQPLPLDDAAAVSLLLTKSELADHFRCSERQIDKLTANGEIPRPIKLGNVRRWRRSAIIQWLDGRGQSKT